MKTIYIDSLNQLFNNEPLSIMLGNFDGFHKGHQQLFSELLKFNTKKSLLTFYPHPLTIIKNIDFKYLDTISDKNEYLCNLIDYLIVIKTTKEILNSSKEDFIQFLQLNKVENVICGRDFTFARNKEGTIKDLNIFNLNVVEDYTIDNIRVSSTEIRSLIKSGSIEKANILLGHDYTIKGIVSKGNQIGRTIGFKTANIEQNEYLFPKCGVYFGYVTIDNNRYYSMINIGTNPTINKEIKSRLEVHIFDFNLDIYNLVIKVSFLKFIRDEKKFNGINELIDELNNNKNYCMKLIECIK